MTNRPFYRVFAWCGALALLAACAPQGSYDLLKKASPEAGDFSQSLASEYLAYAESQLELGHKEDADYFAAKGLRALAGEPVAPEAELIELTQARTVLLSLLNPNVKRVSPGESARAQLLYDCWHHQQKSVAQGEDAPCALEFEDVVEELQTVAAYFVPSPKRKFTFQFSSVSATLTEKMQRQLDQVAITATSLNAYQIILYVVPYGHGEYENLGEERLYVLRAGLMDRNVPAGKIALQNGQVGKAVYLSHDKKARPRNSITVQIKTAGIIAGETP